MWVGFEILLRSRSVGISSRRAEWFVRWAEEVAGSPTVHTSTFEEELGRIMFVAGALEHERPFLAPLYKFLTMHPRDAVRRVPPYVSFILKYLANEISKKRHYKVALKLKFGQDPEPDDTRVLIVTSITDNRGNGAALNKLMSTRFPSSAVLMELATYMKARGMRAIVEWSPHECNKDADLLANGITDRFHPERRMLVSAQSLVWNILPKALEAGRQAEQAYAHLKETHGLPVRTRKQRTRRVESRLKVTDPW